MAKIAIIIAERVSMIMNLWTPSAHDKCLTPLYGALRDNNLGRMRACAQAGSTSLGALIVTPRS